VRRADFASSMDIERGMRTWEDAAAYRNFLNRFAENHGRDGNEVVRLLAEGCRTEAAALVHKLKGAAGSLALMRVWQIAGKLEQTLHHEKDPQPLAASLSAVLAEAISDIKSFMPCRETAPVMTARDDSPTACLCDDLLRALEQDCLDDAESIATRLSGKLPAAPLAALWQRLDSFDLRGAEAIARGLAAHPVNSVIEAMVP